MNQLLIPTQYQHLTQVIHSNLATAAEADFDITAIDLGISPTHLFQIKIDDKSQEYDYDPVKVGPEGGAIACIYTKDNAQATRLIDQYPGQVVMLGLGREAHGFDCWQHLGERRAIQYSIGQCSTSSELHFGWLLTALVLDFPLEDALMVARAMTQDGVSRETWPDADYHFPVPVLNDKPLGIFTNRLNQDDFAPVEPDKLGLYPVVDSVVWIERLLKLGITTLQLRIKNPNQPDLEQQIERAAFLGREHKAQLFINDYWQFAIKHQAYGVHLGQEDLSVADLEQIQQAGLRIGLSTHGYYELLRIRRLKPSYIALGHIFPTTTKQMPSKPQGLVRLAHYQKALGDTPTVAIGGIDMSNAKQVYACGVTSLAVVRAITLSRDPKKVIDDFNQTIFNQAEKISC
ncbi:thiamine phosphate synthase [Vibrio hannami]|uniref:thiamine phosphate synthase n=1 Tax=Vibrio hannami TaxID=2717094 RepID=UPI003EB74123